MQSPQIIRLEDLPPVPWRNGLGSTRVIAGSEPDAAWRLSVADLTQDGDFSSFEGWDRTFCVYGQSPVELTVAGETRLLLPGQTLSFDGEAPVRAALPEGPSQALNLMTRRGSASGTIEVAELGAGQALKPDVVAVAPLEDAAGGGEQPLRHGQILLHPGGAPAPGTPARVALVRVS